MDKLDLNSLFGDEKIDIDCPECNYNFKVEFKLITSNGDIVKCPSCSEDITITHTDETKKTISDGNKALKDFENTLKNFGK